MLLQKNQEATEAIESKGLKRNKKKKTHTHTRVYQINRAEIRHQKKKRTFAR
jgi:hypothetical protein